MTTERASTGRNMVDTYLVFFFDLALIKLLHYGVRVVGQYIQKHIKTNIYTPKKSFSTNT